MPEKTDTKAPAAEKEVTPEVDILGDMLHDDVNVPQELDPAVRDADAEDDEAEAQTDDAKAKADAEAKAKADADPFAALPDDLKKTIREREEQAEKRVRDTQAQYQKDHQELLELRKRLEQQPQPKPPEQKPTETKADGDDEDKLRAMWEDDPQKAFLHIAKLTGQRVRDVREEYERRIAEVREEASRRDIERQEAQARTQFTDYDAVVTEFLVPEMQKDQSVQQKWREMGGTAEAAYKLGKQMKGFREFSENPDAYRDKLRKEIEEELARKRNGEEPTTLSGVRSSGDPRDGKNKTTKSPYDDSDGVLDDVLSGIGRRT